MLTTAQTLLDILQPSPSFEDYLHGGRLYPAHSLSLLEHPYILRDMLAALEYKAHYGLLYGRFDLSWCVILVLVLVSGLILAKVAPQDATGAASQGGS